MLLYECLGLMPVGLVCGIRLPCLICWFGLLLLCDCLVLLRLEELCLVLLFAVVEFLGFC